MEFRDAVKYFRKEQGITQVELANTLHINTATVRRWELGHNLPSRSVVAALIDYAQKSGASHDCLEMLKQSTAGAAKSRLEKKNGKLFSVEHASLGQLIDDASFPIYVCDLETDEFLYINHACEKLFGGTLAQLKSKKCYECLMARSSPCQFCHKDELVSDHFTTYQTFRPRDNINQIVQGKLIQWNGRKAHVRYIIDYSSFLEVPEQSIRESAYEQQLSLRRELAGEAIAVAHYNLTRNTVADVVSSNAEYEKLLVSHPIDDILARIRNDLFLEEDLVEMESISDRKALIQRFYEGKTHITFRHYIESMSGVFEGTFDLMQNPVSYDIEAFAQLHDITHNVMRAEIAKRLYAIDYETIFTINAETGEASPFIGGHLHDVIAEQKIVGDNVAGVASYLRKYCADEDVERIITGTSLPYVKRQLASNSYYHITYSLRLGDKTVYKRTLYCYLDRRRRTILCAMQDLTELHTMENSKRNQMAEALQTLQEQAGMDIARYDLKSKRFYSNSAMANAVGYGDIIENVPEEFIEKGFVAPAYAGQYRAFFDKLHQGEAGSISFQARVSDGSLHWLHIDAHLICTPDGAPYQALLTFKDIENEVEQAAVYKKWRQKLEQKKQNDYTLYRCNLSKDASFDKTEGTLLKIKFTPEARLFNDRTKEYAGRFVHIDDFDAYTRLLNAENLLAGYYRGTHTATLDYRERVSVDAYQWLRVTVDLAQYPDSQDVEAFLMYERADAAPSEAVPAQTLQGVALKNTGIVVVKYDWDKQQFTYDPALSNYLWGRYDDRPLWEIFMTDGVVDMQDLKLMQEMVSELAKTPGRTNGILELVLKTPSGAEHWFNFYALKQVDEANKAVSIIMTFLDINDDVLANRKLRFMAEHDQLTGLYNRSSFLKIVNETIRHRPADSCLLVCSDINDFGFFNNRYGREEGDKLLKYSAELLRSYIKAKGGFAGRMNNDVFAFLLPNSDGVPERMTAVVRDFFADYPLQAKLSGRAGICVISDPSLKADTILDRAVAAKDSIKGKYDKWVALYDDGMNEAYLKEKYITDRMENALANGQFDVYFQPQFHHVTGQLVGAEALARWLDPERGVVCPGEFIPLFEKNGFITKFDQFIWERTAQYISAWMAKGNVPVPISVNISREDVNDPAFCQKLQAIVDKYCIPSSIYRLEITESLLAKDPLHLAAVMDELHNAGFLVEMDDFGSCYSSLNILKDVPVDILKLDMRFFSGGDNPGRGGMIINAVLRMSRWLNIPVIAEGVELKEQADFLLSVGCPVIQGYLYEKPMPAAEFEKLLSGDRRNKAIPRNLVDTELDAPGFWNPLSVDSQVFNNYIGPAAVFEYHDGDYEIVRINLRFLQALGINETAVNLYDRRILHICEEDKPKLNKAVLDVIYSGKDVKTSVNGGLRDGAKRTLNITMRIIAKSADRALIFAVLET